MNDGKTDGYDRQLLGISLVGKAIFNQIIPPGIFLIDSSILATPKLKNDSILERYKCGLIPQRNPNSTPPPEQLLPTRILDAPGLADDYYLNLLDWSKAHNHLAVALGEELFIWNAATGQVRSVIKGGEVDDDPITAVSWASNGLLAVGTKQGRLEVIDVERGQRQATCRAHTARIGVLAWLGGKLCSGGRDRAIVHYDPRQPRMCLARICGAHEQEICGMKWEKSSNSLLATGGNDNQLLIWDSRRYESPILRLNEHVAAVKALAWSPHQRGLLASGGGTACRTIRFWNVQQSFEPTRSISHTITASQVCNLLWSPHAPELVTTHGFSEHLCLRWSYPEMKITGVMRGHSQRVLYLTCSPDGTTVATGGADETIRLWPIFSRPQTHHPSSSLLYPNWGRQAHSNPFLELPSLR